MFMFFQLVNDAATSGGTTLIETSGGGSNMIYLIGVVIVSILGMFFVNWKRASNKSINQRADDVKVNEETHGALINSELEQANNIDTQIETKKEEAQNLVDEVHNIVNAGNVQIEQDSLQTPQQIKQDIANKWKDI